MAVVPPASNGHGTKEESTPESVDAQASMAEAPLLTFSEHMWDRFEFLWQHRVEPSRRVLEEFLQSLRDRAQLERHYANGLSRTTARLEATSPGGLPEAMEAVAVNMRNRAEQSSKLAEDIEVDVCETLAAMLRQHAEVSKRVLKDGRQGSQIWQEARRQHEQTAAKYSRACLEAEVAVQEMESAARLRNQERFQIGARMLKLQRQAVHAEREYYQAVHRLNEVTETHKLKMGHVLEALQKMEEKRTLCFKDTAMKLAVYDVSWLRNMQYDLDGVVQTLESADGLKELQDFIHQHQSKEPPHPTVRIQAFWELPAASQATPPHRPAATGEADSEALGRWREEVVRPAVRSILARTDCEASAEAIAGLRCSFSAAEGAPLAQVSEEAAGVAATRAPVAGPSVARSLFCTALEEELRQQAVASDPGSRGMDLEALPPTSVSQACFEELVSLFKSALDGCQKEEDHWCARRFLAFSKLFRGSVDGKDVDLSHRVYNHPLWSSVPFWESALMVGIFEAHAASATRRRALGAGAKTHEVVMTAFLQRFVHYMCSLGIQRDQAVKSVQKTLNKFVHVLGQPLAEAYFDQMTRTVAPAAPSSSPTPVAAAVAPVASNAVAGAAAGANGELCAA